MSPDQRLTVARADVAADGRTTAGRARGGRSGRGGRPGERRAARPGRRGRGRRRGRGGPGRQRRRPFRAPALVRARARAGGAGPVPRYQAWDRPADRARLLLRLRGRPAVHPGGLERIDARMREIVAEGQRFSRRVVSESEALAELADQPFKCELVGLKGASGEEAVEAGGTELTMYDNLDPGQRQAHLDRPVPRPAPARDRPDPRVPADAHRRRLLARRRAQPQPAARLWDRLGERAGPRRPRHPARRGGAPRPPPARRRADLFSFPPEIGSGLAVWHPRGGAVRRVMEDYSRQAHEAAGYEFVGQTAHREVDPVRDLGPPGWYAEGMYPPWRWRGPSTTRSR